MQLPRFFLLFALCAGSAVSQNGTFPLESVSIEGSGIPQPVILEMAGLRIGAALDKSGIEAGCRRLQESGLFASISYRFVPGPQKGFALTLVLADQSPLVAATIDVPGIDEKEAWQWLSARFQVFDRRVPGADPAQRFLAGEIEGHLGSKLRGKHLVARMESDLTKNEMMVSFQPEGLPAVRSVAFTGNQTVASGKLESALSPVLGNPGFRYTERKLTEAVELNLRPVYEEYGLYRVRFAPSEPRWVETGVDLTIAITEGSPYQLGKVEITGEDLPLEAMVSAAKFPKGKLANWKKIQESVWEMEKVLKRRGFLAVSSVFERSFDDAGRALDLRVKVSKGPVYRLGEVRVTGLSPELEGKARRVWKPKAGEPYDYAYPNDFFQEFSKTVDFGGFRKYKADMQMRANEPVIDINLVFERR
jgi:outer membrane protein assembly factor BamA